jgi:hypothetical protein
MTVYVDDVRHSFGRMIMCHLWADTLDELFAMVDRIGVRRQWLQQPPKASWAHFDVSLAMKAKALANGAVLTDMFGPVEWQAKRDIETGDEMMVDYGKMRLEQIVKSRAHRALGGKFDDASRQGTLL